MKSFVIASAVLMLFAAPAVASDLAVSESALEGMGLAGMQRMSDEDGMAVRGKGFLDNLGLATVGGDFGGDFGGGGFGGAPEGFGNLQLGDVIGGAIINEINGLDIGIGLPHNLGIPSDLGLGSFGGFGF